MSGLTELHAHLLGCLTAEQVRARLAPEEDPAVFRERFVLNDDDAGDFSRFQKKFDLILAAHEREDPVSAAHDLVRTAEDALDDARRQGVTHIEYRLRPPKDPARALEHILEVFDNARDVDAHLAISLPREDPMPLFEVATSLDHPRVCAIDFCFFEEGHPPKTLADFAVRLHAFNRDHPARSLAWLHHVGESFSDKSFESAIRWVDEASAMGAHRLGHALCLSMTPSLGEVRTERADEREDQLRWERDNRADLEAKGASIDTFEGLEVRYDAARITGVRARQALVMERLVARGTVVEVCPSSNRLIGGLAKAARPWLRLEAAGVPVVVGTDDSGFFDVTLDDEIARSGLDRVKVIKTARRSTSNLLAGRPGVRLL